MEIIKPSPQTEVVVAYQRWSFTRDSTYRALTRKIWVFWVDGPLQKVVAHEGLTVSVNLHTLTGKW